MEVSPEELQTTDSITVRALKDISFGSAAGVAAKFFEHPFDLTKVRLQSQVLDAQARFSGPIDCLVQTWRKEGVCGLYRVRRSLYVHREECGAEKVRTGPTGTNRRRDGGERVAVLGVYGTATRDAVVDGHANQPVALARPARACGRRRGYPHQFRPVSNQNASSQGCD